MQTVTPAEVLGTLNSFEAKNAPSTLYLDGDADLLRRSPRIAIVGSRKASAEGLRRARQLAGTLAREGAVIVSGLAEGIDTAAHSAAIEAGGSTIAVLGTPLGIAYPTRNRELLATIMREHLAVSQFPAGYPSQPKNFVLRNRTMALLSDATIIVEAGEKSGTVHQGWEAIRLGRPLFLLESLAQAPGLTWPAKLQDYGAQVLTRDDLATLIEELPSGPLADAASF